jgi:polysaccharide chain length determinant protein (PEP-CTERM system associated)
VVRHRVFVVLTFLLIGCAGLVVGLNWPKIYTSSTSIYVEEENILGPLMEGAAVQTEVIDRSSIARDILYGRKILLRVLAELGISDEATDPVKQERIMEEIKGRTLVTGGRNLIRIEYSDSDPEKAFEITRLLAELFIAESLADKARESQSAYDFINQQVEEYKAKLVASEDQLKKFRSENADVVSGMGQEIGRQITELNNQVETIAQELNEARITRDSLVRQLTGQAQTFSAFSQAEENRTRIGELQAQLDTLRLSYHETYPDIVRIKAQIADLRQAIARDEQRPPTGGAGGQVRLDERALANPLYQELQGQLYDTNTLIRTLESRLARARETLRNTIARSKDTQEYEAQLAELARDYEVNKEIYADMTRRRESGACP